jgi:hypothetical protein
MTWFLSPSESENLQGWIDPDKAYFIPRLPPIESVGKDFILSRTCSKFWESLMNPKKTSKFLTGSKLIWAFKDRELVPFAPILRMMGTD